MPRSQSQNQAACPQSLMSGAQVIGVPCKSDTKTDSKTETSESETKAFVNPSGHTIQFITFCMVLILLESIVLLKIVNIHSGSLSEAEESTNHYTAVMSVCLSVGVFICLWVCYHDNLKLCASILTKLGL